MRTRIVDDRPVGLRWNNGRLEYARRWSEGERQGVEWVAVPSITTPAPEVKPPLTVAEWWNQHRDNDCWTGAIARTPWDELWPEAQAELTKLFNAACGGRIWQPIETAPKDGKRVLLWTGKEAVMSRWCVHYLGGEPDPRRPPEWEQADMYGGFGGYQGPLQPTGWMRPWPPETEETPQGGSDAA